MNFNIRLGVISFALFCFCADVHQIVAQQKKVPFAVDRVVQAQAIVVDKNKEENLRKDLPVNNFRALGLDDLISRSLATHPRLGKAGFVVEQAKGYHYQAGLYPNPVLNLVGDELGDVQGPVGILTIPGISQEIVTASKLSLGQAVAAKEVDGANLRLLEERYELIGSIRAQYIAVICLQRRAQVYADLVQLTETATKNSQALFENNLLPKLALLRQEVALERIRAEELAISAQLVAAFQALAAVAGDLQLPPQLLGSLLDQPVPVYDADQLRSVVLQIHPRVRRFQVEIEQRTAQLAKANADVIPNVTVSTGYVYQGQNKSHDWTLGVSVPIPSWNRNEGNIFAARMGIHIAQKQLEVVQLELAEGVAKTYQDYAAGLAKVKQYQEKILPRIEDLYQQSLKAFQQGQLPFNDITLVQQNLVNTRLEFLQEQERAWQAAARLSALLMEDQWPPARQK
ncbi:MAG: TolC family protein [Zavarzinella sp.]